MKFLEAVQATYRKALAALDEGDDETLGGLSLEKWWAYLYACATDGPVFITGNAGAGKSYLLKYIKNESLFKDYTVVAAPTGLAALNVDGTTLHKLFGLHVGKVLRAKEVGGLTGGFQLNHGKKIAELMQLLIIDEISMVRADVIDAIDRVLRYYRDPQIPFGGVKLIMFGDLRQLPPVEDRRWELDQYAKDTYGGSPYFIDSLAFRNNPPTCLELTEIHRQTDDDFIGVLNRIRENNASDNDFNWLNSATASNRNGDDALRVYTKNKSVNAHNQSKLTALGSPIRIFQAGLYGKNAAGGIEVKEQEFQLVDDMKFEDLELNESDPTDRYLQIAVGAKVMFIRNHADGLWVNGTMGTVTDVSSDTITVLIGDSSKAKVRVSREVWSRYSWEPKKVVSDDGKIRTILEQYEVGRFVQFPLRLAWAATVHKVQGQTFDQLTLDLSDGTFSPGHAYVALSRVREVKGLELKSKVSKSHLLPTAKSVEDYLSKYPKRFDGVTHAKKAPIYRQNIQDAQNEADKAERARVARESDLRIVTNSVCAKFSVSEEILARALKMSPIRWGSIPNLQSDILNASNTKESFESYIMNLNQVNVSGFLEDVTNKCDSSLKQAVRFITLEGVDYETTFESRLDQSRLPTLMTLDWHERVEYCTKLGLESPERLCELVLQLLRE